MSFPNWNIQPETVFNISPVIPILVIREIEQAVPLANALFSGGIHTIEVVLRTKVALEALKLLIDTFPEALIGAGTVITPEQLQHTASLGAKFALSPGKTQGLLTSGCFSNIPLIPGISSVSELMEGIALGYTHFKFFPAALSGGVNMLRAMYSLFPEVRFCPTGGINEANCLDYLELPNVSCVGGTWIVPEDAIEKNNWSLITDLCFSIHQKIQK